MQAVDINRLIRNKWLIGSALLALALIALWVLNVSRPGTRIEGCAEGCATAGPRQEGPLRVMSLNMLHGFPRFAHLEKRLALIAATIGEADADIVCLQEVPWHWGSAARRLAEATGLNYLYLRANGNRWAILFEEGETILSRYPLRDAAFVELEPQAGTFEHRVALRATVVTPQGPLRVFVTHLTNGDRRVNQGQAASLAAFVARSREGPAVVAGDFNATEDEPQIQALGWVDTYRSAQPLDPGHTCCVDDLTAGPSEPLEKRIDYIFLLPSGQADVVSSQRLLAQPTWTEDGWLWASDHAGVLSEIALSSPAPQSTNLLLAQSVDLADGDDKQYSRILAVQFTNYSLGCLDDSINLGLVLDYRE